MRTAAVLGATLALLATATPSAAKGPQTIFVCGPGGCLGTRDARALRQLHRAVYPEKVVPRASPPPVGTYYELRGDREKFVYGYFVRGWRSISLTTQLAEPGWRRAGADLTRELDRLSARLRPFPRPQPTRLEVGSRRISGAGDFLPLLGPLPRAARSPASEMRLLSFSWPRTNPWSGFAWMQWDAADGRLFRGGVWYRVPDRLARRLR